MQDSGFKHIKKIILSVALLLCPLALLISNTAARQEGVAQKHPDIKKKDTLTTHLETLFDYIDANPQVTISSDDSLMQTLWRAPHTSEEKLAWYQLLINMAYHLLQYRQIPASIKWYEQAFQFYKQHRQDSILEAEMNFEEYVCKPLGNNYTRMGDFSKALFIQQTAVQSAVQKKLYNIVPGLYGNLATTYFHAQQYDSVQYYIDAGLKRTPHGHPQTLNLYNLKAEAFLETAQIDSALRWNNSALQLLPRFSAINIDAAIITYLDKARLLNQRKAYAQAVGFLRRAWAMAPAQNIAEKVEIAIETGNVFLLSGNRDSSSYWHQAALNFFTLNEQGLYPDFKVTTAMFGIASALMYDDEASAATWFEKAVLNDYYTQQLLPASLNSRTAAYANSAYSEVAIAMHHQLFDKTSDEEYLLKALWLAELSKGRKLLSEQQRSREWLSDSILIKNKALSDELKSLYLNLAETKSEIFKEKVKQKISELEYSLNLTEGNYNRLLRAPKYSDFKNWVHQTTAQVSLLSYYWGQSYLYAVCINNHGFRHFLDTAVQNRVQELHAFTQDYFYKGPEAFNNNPHAYYSQSNHLLQQFIPWHAMIKGDVYISADGPLHSLPFEALSMQQALPQYFGEQNSVAYDFSFLQQLYQPAKAKTKPMINIFTFEKAHLGFSALPESVREKDFLSQQFKVLSQSAPATATAQFIRSLQSGNIIHFASHAVAGPSSVNNYLVLKDKLYLGQLQYITARCPLLVLAACETGAGQLTKGEGMETLGRAFLSKGVDGVIVTRWPVDDGAASEIMELFYQHLKKNDKPAKALQLARQEYMNTRQSVAAKNPWLWAAFTYQGINTTVAPAPASKVYWWLLPLITLAGIAFILQKRFV